MEHDAFRYQFTMKELAFLLLRKKVCPRCGGKMRKQDRPQIVSGASLNHRRDAFFRPDARVKDHRYVFICCRCGCEASLSELAK